MRLFTLAALYVFFTASAAQAQTLGGTLLWTIPDSRFMNPGSPPLRVIKMDDRFYSKGTWMVTDSSLKPKPLMFTFGMWFQNGKPSSASTVDVQRTDLQETDRYLGIILDYAKRRGPVDSYLLICMDMETELGYAYHIKCASDENGKLRHIDLHHFNKQWIQDYVAKNEKLRYAYQLIGKDKKKVTAIGANNGDIHDMFVQAFANRNIAIESKPSSKLYPKTDKGRGFLAIDRQEMKLKELLVTGLGVGVGLAIANKQNAASKAKANVENSEAHPTHKLVQCDVCEGEGKIWKLAWGVCVECKGNYSRPLQGEICRNCMSGFFRDPGRSNDYRWVPCETCNESGQRWVPK